MLATKTLRAAAVHAERQPLIRFIGKRTTPASVDHTPHPHPASPTNKLPESFSSGPDSHSHASFSSYRDSVQQHGPLRKSVKSLAERGIGGSAGSDLGAVDAPKGFLFDRNDLPARFRRARLSIEEIESVETGGAAAFA